MFPFARFPGVDLLLGPEMKSTGEVMGLDRDFAAAFVKSQLGAGTELPASGTVFVSVRDRDKPAAVALAQRLHELGFTLAATRGTAAALAAAGLPVDDGQEGPRRPAAHRRPDQERRHRAADQHHRGPAGDPRQLRAAPRRADGASCPTTRRCRARGPWCRHWTGCSRVSLK